MTVLAESFLDAAHSSWACDSCGKQSGPPTAEEALVLRGWRIHEFERFTGKPKHHTCPDCSAKKEIAA